MIILLIWYILWESSLVLQDAIGHYRKVVLSFWRISSFGGGLCWDLLPPPDEKEKVPPRRQDPKHVFVRCSLSTYPVWGSHAQLLQRLFTTVRVGTQWCIIAFQHQLSCLVVATLQIVVNATAHVGACVTHFAALICLIFSSIYD